MEITYEFVQNVEAAEVSDVFRKSGIHRPVNDSKRIQQMIDNANIIVTARVDGQLVGVARGLTDYAWCCYLSDLAVDKEFQRMGIGKELIKRIQNQLGEGVKILLIAAEKAADYYPHIGFEKVDRAFHIPRKF